MNVSYFSHSCTVGKDIRPHGVPEKIEEKYEKKGTKKPHKTTKGKPLFSWKLTFNYVK